MDFDSAPCRVCGAEVELRPWSATDLADEVDQAISQGPVGPEDGFVGDADSTPDRRICTNESCPSHSDRAQEA